MTLYKTILLTGSGGDIGTGIARILKENGLVETLVGADISKDNAGTFLCDVNEVLPRADNPTYFDAVEKLIHTHDVKLIIPMSEAEIRLWYRSGYTDTFKNIPVVMPNSQVFDKAIDKMATADFLKSLSLPFPWTSLVSDGLPIEYPCIIKSRGTGDKGGVEIIADESTAIYMSARRPGNIWQQFLEGDEYTAGVYGCLDGEVRNIVLKRKLSGGMTGYTTGGEVVEDQNISHVLIKLGQALNLRGSMNVQLRLTEKGPVVFEINPRFSSTVVFRHKLGFKDVVWSLEEKAGHKVSDYTPPRQGTKFFKGYAEYVEGQSIAVN